MDNNILVGSNVKFYNVKQAFKERNFSGTNQEHYPIGEVIKIYTLDEEKLCDVSFDNQISKGHFISSVELIN